MNACKLGHCCSKASIEKGKVVKPDRCYITAQPCTPGIQPAQFSAGYCDPKSHKIVIIGLKSPKGHTLQKSPAIPELCKTDADCSKDSSVLCLRENSKDPEAYCYLNPLNERTEKEESIPTTIIIIIAVILVVLIILIGGALFCSKMKKKAGKKNEKVNKARSKPKSISKTNTTSKSNEPEPRREFDEIERVAV